MLDLTRPKIIIPDDSKISINPFKNPYLMKLNFRAIPQYNKIKEPTFFSPLDHRNVSISQTIPIWRN